MNAVPYFSVVIPTYNRADFLREALQSLAAQQFRDFETIVVDDGSNDDTETVARSCGLQLQFLRQAQAGPGVARNWGVANARGRYVAFLDSDDVYFPWSLSVYAEVIQSHQEPSFVSGKQKFFQSANELPAVKRAPLEVSVFADYLASGDQWRWWGASSFVIRRDQFQAACGFATEKINGEDADLALRLGTAPGFVQIKGCDTFGYRRHSSNIISNVALTLQGNQFMVSREKSGLYPGRHARCWERRRIIARHARPVTEQAVRAGLIGPSWALYRDTLTWNLALGEWKYLTFFPLLTTRWAWKTKGRQGPAIL